MSAVASAAAAVSAAVSAVAAVAAVVVIVAMTIVDGVLTSITVTWEVGYRVCQETLAQRHIHIHIHTHMHIHIRRMRVAAVAVVPAQAGLASTLIRMTTAHLVLPHHGIRMNSSEYVVSRRSRQHSRRHSRI